MSDPCCDEDKEVTEEDLLRADNLTAEEIADCLEKTQKKKKE